MKYLILALTLTAALLSTGCGSVSTQYQYDDSRDFADLKTYMVHLAPWQTSDSKSDTPTSSERIATAVNAVLPGRGLIKVAKKEQADVLVTFRASVVKKTARFDDSPLSPGHWDGGHSTFYEMSEREVEQGTLVLDFVDTKTNKLIWRGVVTGVVNTKSSLAARQARVTEGVRILLSKYPPK